MLTRYFVENEGLLNVVYPFWKPSGSRVEVVKADDLAALELQHKIEIETINEKIAATTKYNGELMQERDQLRARVQELETALGEVAGYNDAKDALADVLNELETWKKSCMQAEVQLAQAKRRLAWMEEGQGYADYKHIRPCPIYRYGQDYNENIHGFCKCGMTSWLAAEPKEE